MIDLQPPKQVEKAPRRPYARTGLNALKARVRVRGLSAIDQRTLAARNLVAWRDSLVSDLGGEETVTAAQRQLIEVASRTRVYLDHVDAFLLEQGSLINKSRRMLFPIVRERTTLADSLLRTLAALGLERRAKPVMDLQTYLATRYPAPSAGKSATAADLTPVPGSQDVPGPAQRGEPAGALPGPAGLRGDDTSATPSTLPDSPIGLTSQDDGEGRP